MNLQFRVLSTVIVVVIIFIASYNFIAHTDETSALREIDRLFSAVDNDATPGAVLAVLKDGEIFYSRGYGMANLEYDIPITTNSIFHVASVSKQFTAFAITTLAYQGKLSFNDDVRKYVPEVPDFGETITIRHLIHHTSGLRDQWELLAMAGWRLDDVITKEHILKMLEHQQDLNFKPGEEYLYSNMGYTILAEIVERVSGQSLKDWTNEHIFEPLGMDDTHFHDDHRHIVPGRAYSYQPTSNDGFQKSVLNYANVGATSLFTTVEDLAKWLKNFDSIQVGNERIISQMHRQGRLNSGEQINYAYALQVNEYRGARTIGHSGADAGYRSFVGRFPQHDFSVIVLSNLSTMSPQRIAYKIADIVLGDNLKSIERHIEPKERTRGEIDLSVIDSYTGNYRMERGIIISLSREDDRLFMQSPGISKVELIPESEEKFFSNDMDIEVTFETDQAGEADHILVNRGGNTVMAVRIDGNVPSTEQLRQYTGNYYSEELGTFYTINLQDDELIAAHRRHSDVELTPIINNRFSGNRWWFRTIEFVKDRSDRVEGFYLSGGRVRNIWFEKR